MWFQSGFNFNNQYYLLYAVKFKPTYLERSFLKGQSNQKAQKQTDLSEKSKERICRCHIKCAKIFVTQ